jgi:hypothetical protein
MPEAGFARRRHSSVCPMGGEKEGAHGGTLGSPMIKTARSIAIT